MKSFNDLYKTNNQYKDAKENIFNKIVNNNSQLKINNFENYDKYLSSKNSEGSKFQIYKKYQNYNPLENEVNTNYKCRISRINIDSKNRNTVPKNIVLNNSTNLSDPFNFQKNSNIITIIYNNHGLTNNDTITISNVIGNEYYLKQFEFIQNSNYIKIYHPSHGMEPFITSDTYSPYQILIQNITNNNSTFYQNIPLNILNDYHNVYFNTDNSNNYDINYYYILINIAPLNNEIINVNYKVIFQHLYGIPIANINANYPISPVFLQGYQTISNIIDNNTFQIIVSYIANTTINRCGGNNISINKIIDYIHGYSDNNHYIINLNKTFYNVIAMKLISTEFPNTEKVIKDSPPDRQNNKLYWQIIGDGNTIYSISITSGNYAVNDLTLEMQSLISNVKMSSLNGNTSTSNYEYLDTFNAQITINVNSNLFSIQFYGTIIVQNPFKIIVNDPIAQTYYLEIFHPNHSLEVNAEIIIQNAIDIGVVPASIINNIPYLIYNIIDKDHYLIQLPRFNLNTTNVDVVSGGGNAVQMNYPLKGRLLFDRLGTIGNIIGFRNVGLPSSITQWNYTINNNTPYINDALLNTSGLPLTSNIISNYINLNGDNYLLITNPLLKNTIDTGGLNGIFAKLLFAGSPGSVLYNQFIQLGEEFIDGILSLSELEFFFYNQTGSLYNFNGLEHSFTIEIYEKISTNNEIIKLSRI